MSGSGLIAELFVRRDDFELQVELSCEAGSTLALVGPNGAGKSTVVDALAGLLPLTEGSIELDGAHIENLPAERRPVGVSFQSDLLFPRLSALENVAFPLRAHGVGKAEAIARAADELRRLAPDIDPSVKPGRLSGGERQRVSLARALVSEPQLLLLDEPLANVDVSGRAEIRALLADIARRFTGVMVLVAHDPTDALTLADRVVVLERGLATQRGTPEEIRRTPRSAYAADLVGVNLFEGSLHPLDDGAATLRTDDGELTVAPATPISDGTPALATLKPVDVSLHIAQPEGSPRNVLPGAIIEIAIDGDRARVRLATSPPLTAEITAGSVTRMGLTIGQDLWASFKAVEVSLQVESNEDTAPAAGTLGR
ncbi:MAG TPA: ABC transporter ATP-binding protein [Actinomycetota bacterium]